MAGSLQAVNHKLARRSAVLLAMSGPSNGFAGVPEREGTPRVLVRCQRPAGRLAPGESENQVWGAAEGRWCVVAPTHHRFVVCSEPAQCPHSDPCLQPFSYCIANDRGVCYRTVPDRSIPPTLVQEMGQRSSGCPSVGGSQNVCDNERSNWRAQHRRPIYLRRAAGKGCGWRATARCGLQATRWMYGPEMGETHATLLKLHTAACGQ